ncbi:hypothetical protein N7471_000529 [Penicillium samsonianum]|uniref:uncharacterized protein n=1 Tax=Penicillium samsonianum TaxID=1882272 RepID=UPI00254747FF|nr:uncharacterized protein N7471_000529 [Penicillium samsonianum]KAJ6149330.1 hypothetical protein N7471_000529 [Penicillium samsonianum]
MEDKSINFLAVMRPSKVLGREGIGSEMTALTGWLHAEQRRLKRQYHIAYTLATDGDVFRVFRMNKVGQNAILGEIRSVSEEMLKELRHKQLEKFFK